jgi:hypothetical protein
MNENIKQIVEDSGLYIAYDNREVTDIEIDFFAKLLIKKCIDILDNPRFENVRPSMNVAQAMIKEQFGVENE